MLSSFFQQNGAVGKIVEIFDFSIGNENFFYTSNDRPFSFANVEYEAVTIKIEDIENNTEIQPIPNSVQIQLSEPAIRYLSTVPPLVMSLKVTWVLEDDPSFFSIIYDGRVLSAKYNKERLTTLSLESKSEILRFKVPTFFHSAQCNNILYDNNCKLREPDFQIEATVSSISANGKVIQASAFSLFDDDYFFKGKCRSDYGDVKLITKHEGNEIEIHIPFDSRVGIGTKLIVSPGCLRRHVEDCITKFDNEDNFRGMPDIPSRNISVWGLEGLINE